MKQHLQKYSHGFMFLYALIYLPWFMWLESRANQPYHVIHMFIDDYIPFIEYFIVPYLLWFFYVSGVLIYLFLANKSEFYKCSIFLFTGMTIFLIISTVYPNGHLLRPISFDHQSIFTDAVQLLYQADTATNIFPSLHVFNSIGAHLAIANNQQLGQNKLVRSGSFVLMVLIIMATVFLKQHSMLDVIGGICLGLAMDQAVYHTDYEALRVRRREKSQKSRKGVVV